MTEDRKITQAKKLIAEADAIVIGAGSGLSSAAGLTYSGQRFCTVYQGIWADRYVFCWLLSLCDQGEKVGLLEPAPLSQSLPDRQFATLSGFV
ncbi:hypothetical protein ODU08_03645 [Streptococcus suis]